VSYNREFLDSYVPNESQYVPKKIQETLFKEGKRFDEQLQQALTLGKSANDS